MQSRGSTVQGSSRPSFRKINPLPGRTLALGFAVVLCACGSEDALTNTTGKMSGQVIVSGPLREATVSVERIDLATGKVAAQVADTTTGKDGDEAGRFSIETREHDGLFRITVRGGKFDDLVTGRTVELDGASELVSLAWLDLFEKREDVLVSPVGHLIEARWRYNFAVSGDVTRAAEDAAKSLNRHFAGVDWMSVQPADLRTPAGSPTEPVRAALVQAAFSVLAHEIAGAAQSTEQEVNSYTLAKQWAADLSPGVDEPGLGIFDGDDDNAHAFNSGMQLALGCKPEPPTCERTGTCPTGKCRTLCDQYAGTPRALFAAAMGKVINDHNVADNPMALNQTTLAPADLLPIAHAINGNVDFELFGRECVEQLDRFPPSLVFLAPTPADGGYAGGIVEVKVQSFDDLDASPRATILGYPDADGDPGNSIARALIDTGDTNGMLRVEVESRDSSGNVVHVERVFTIDNIAPALELAPAGFIIDPDPSAPNDPQKATWWTADSMPTLRGTVTDAAPVTISAVVNGIAKPGSVTGTGFEILVDDIASAGTDVAIVATDAAGNTRQVIRRIRPDATPPTLGFQPSTVNDEAMEAATFNPADENPVHSHNGAPVDLTATGPGTGCPVIITKHSYLLGASTPEYVTEQPGRNPIAYHLVAADDGVGLVPNTTRVRVRRHEPGGATTVVADGPAGTGSPLPNGARLFDVSIVKEMVPELDLRQATYDVEFETRDRFGRASVPTTRCFELRLKAPPMKFEQPTISSGHTFSLNSLTLAPSASPIFRKIGSRLLNNSSTGASLIDQRFTNSTTATVFLAVNVTKPMNVIATMRFEIRNHRFTRTVNFDCSDEDNPPQNCQSTANIPNASLAPYSGTAQPTVGSLAYPAKLFELNGAGEPTTEIPCVAPCPGPLFTFVVPGRAPAGAPRRRFIVMTMIQPVTALRPTDLSRPLPPSNIVSELTANNTGYTGFQHFHSFGCGGSIGNNCVQEKTFWQFRALTDVGLDFQEPTSTTYAVSPNAQVAPVAVSVLTRQPTEDWSSHIDPAQLPNHNQN